MKLPRKTHIPTVHPSINAYRQVWCPLSDGQHRPYFIVKGGSDLVAIPRVHCRCCKNRLLRLRCLFQGEEAMGLRLYSGIRKKARGAPLHHFFPCSIPICFLLLLLLLLCVFLMFFFEIMVQIFYIGTA